MKTVSQFLAGALCLPTALAAWTNLTASDYTISDTGAADLSGLDSVLPIQSVNEVLASANHVNPDSSPDVKHLVPGSAFTWENVPGYNDENGLKWFPQGLSTSFDASDSGTYRGDSVLLVSWHCDYYYLGKRGARVSFVNMNDGAERKYRNVLLVEPTTTKDGQPDFRAIEKLHAGGLAWVGDYLYVASTGTGLRVFDLKHIYQVTEGNGIGKVGDGYEAFGYDYVIPQVRQYNWVPRDGVKDFRWSYISLDRTSSPATLIAGEYNTGTPNRLIHFPIDLDTGLLTVNSNNVAVSSSAISHELSKIQGTTMVDGKYYMTQSGGSLWTFTWMEGEKENADVFSSVPEDVSYQPGLGLWTLMEMPWHRNVFALDMAQLA